MYRELDPKHIVARAGAIRLGEVSGLLLRIAVNHEQIGRSLRSVFNDPVVLSAVNDVESLTQGLAVKIWQKIMILDSISTSAEPAK